jgi:formylglycine-generating enzyme required for sulfatase activity
MRFLLGTSFLIPLLIGLLISNDFAQAQLERLRKHGPVEQAAPAETPMVEIPAGEFAMGLDGMQALEDERPKHLVWLPVFFIDLHEVTTVQYASFLTATNRLVPWQWDTVDLTQHHDRPVIANGSHDRAMTMYTAFFRGP